MICTEDETLKSSLLLTWGNGILGTCTLKYKYSKYTMDHVCTVQEVYTLGKEQTRPLPIIHLYLCFPTGSHPLTPPTLSVQQTTLELSSSTVFFLF